MPTADPPDAARAPIQAGPPRTLRLLGGILLALAVLAPVSCFRRPPDTPMADKPRNLDQVTTPPRLLYCKRYRPPRRNDAPSHAVQVRFVVTRNGAVRDAECVQEGPLLSSDALIGEAISMAQSCTFRPGRVYGTPVAVRMTRWFYW